MLLNLLTVSTKGNNTLKISVAQKIKYKDYHDNLSY